MKINGNRGGARGGLGGYSPSLKYASSTSEDKIIFLLRIFDNNGSLKAVF